MKSAMVGSEGRARVSRRLEQAGNSVRQRQGRVSVTFNNNKKKGAGQGESNLQIDEREGQGWMK